MSRNTATQRNERMTNVLLKTACEEAWQQDIDAIPSDEVLAQLYPDTSSLDNKIAIVIKQAKNTYRLRQTVRMAGRAAAILLVLFLVSLVPIMTIEASRNFIRNIFVDVRSDHVLVDFGGSLGVDATFSQRVTAHMPTGFLLAGSHASDALVFLSFENAVGQYIDIFHHVTYDATLAIDNEERMLSYMMLNNIRLLLFEAQEPDEAHTVIWEYGSGMVYIASNMALDALLRFISQVL